MIHAELHDTRMLVLDRGAVVVEGKRLLGNADDAAYSPDGTLVAFARDGDLWLANADGSGQRRLARTPNVTEWGPSWLPGGVHRANEGFHLRESRYDDNIASELIRLAWRGGVRAVTPLRRCRKERC